MPTLDQTVATVVLDHSETAQIFQRHRIDFCCHGDKTVAVAAAERKLDAQALLAELTQAIAGREGAPAADPRELPTEQLVEHIISKHHVYLRGALPFVQRLATKVGRVHGDHNPKLQGLAVVVDELVEALLPHLDDEEERLFPALLAKEQDRADLARQFAEMTREHEEVATLLERARAASDDYALPDWACNSYRTLFAELQQLERDVFTHVHLEHHALRPRFAAAA